MLLSRKTQPKNKDLVSLAVVPREVVWTTDKHCKYRLKSNLDIYGKVKKGFSVGVMSTNLRGENHKYVDDTARLPKNAKDKIVDMFYNNNKQVAYLVRTDNPDKPFAKQGKTKATKPNNKK